VLATNFNTELPTDFLCLAQWGTNSSGTGNVRFYASLGGFTITVGARWTTSHNWVFDTGVSSAFAVRFSNNSLKTMHHSTSQPWTTWTEDVQLASGGVSLLGAAGVGEYKFDSAITLIKNIGPAQFMPKITAGAATWDFRQNGVDTPYWESEANLSFIYIPVSFPVDGASYNITVSAMVKPGAVRTYSNRMRLTLAGAIPDWETPAQPTFDEISEDYDDGTTDVQILTQTESITREEGRYMAVWIRSGDDGATNKDRVYAVKVQLDVLKQPTHFGSV
jgi:hypothetical protein